MLFPMDYFILILPVALCRLTHIQIDPNTTATPDSCSATRPTVFELLY